MIINYCPAYCGAGKTHKIVNRGCELASRGENVLIVQPTKELINKTVESELLMRPNIPSYKVIDGDTVGSGSVASALTEYSKLVASSYSKQMTSEGHIVFTTHQSLPYVRYFEQKHKWHVLIDEAPQIPGYSNYKVPHTHPILTDHIELEPYNAIYSRLIGDDEDALKELGINEQDDEILERFSDTARTIINEHSESYVNTERFTKLRDGGATKLDIHSILLPSFLEGFASVFMAAANFEDTAIFHIWREFDVTFVKDIDFTNSLRFQRHENGGLITIFYALDGPWSKRLQTTTWKQCGDETTLQLLVSAVAEKFENTRFVWQGNKDLLESPFKANAERLPNMPHGINSYLNVNNIAFLSALNPTPDHCAFLKDCFGFDRDTVQKMFYYSVAYQSVMRTSIRDPQNDQPKTIIVPDVGLAEYLQSLFPGSRVEKLDSRIPSVPVKKNGRPRKHNDRRSVYRKRKQEKKRQELLQQMRLVRPYASQSKLYHCKSGMSGDETTIESIKGFVTYAAGFSLNNNLVGAVYRDKFSSMPVGYISNVCFDEFAQFLKEMHSRRLDRKESSGLISPAICDPGRSTNSNRGSENILYLRHLWMDFEEGDLKPEELPKLFPHTQMLVMNSFNHTTKNPRFRAVFAVKQPLTPEAYIALWDIIADKFRDAGYKVRKGKPNKGKKKPDGKRQLESGLDWQKRSPASLFYLPSQAQNPSESFFNDYNDQDREEIDAELWISRSQILLDDNRVFEPPNEFSQTAINETKVQEAVYRWRNSKDYPGEGSQRFFNFALDLRSAGMHLSEIEAKLRQEADHGRSPNERRSQIKSIRDSLRKSFRRRVPISGSAYIASR